VLVEPADGGPRLWFQRVPEGKVVKNRVHLDLLATDLDDEVGRLTGLGATVLARHADHVVLADPEGNEFCLAPER
jgi:predicted enzyme related to lactoylglutathione lyase